VLEAVELPAGVAHLDAGLAHVNGDALAHGEAAEDARDSGGFEVGVQSQKRPFQRRIHERGGTQRPNGR
jgi:hypothetical protein